MERLSESMNLENTASDLGFEMMLKLVQSRVQQLIQQEATALVESRSLTSSLQRKVQQLNLGNHGGVTVTRSKQNVPIFNS